MKNKNKHFNQFKKTGSIKDYLKYKEETSKELIKKNEKENK